MHSIELRKTDLGDPPHGKREEIQAQVPVRNAIANVLLPLPGAIFVAAFEALIHV